MKRIPLFVLLICYFSSCKVIEPHPPSLPPSQINNEPLPYSKIDAAVSVNLERVFSEFDGTIARDFGEERQVNDFLKYSWYVHRQPLILALNNDGSLDAANAANCGGEAKVKNPINGNWGHLCGCDAVANINLHARFALNTEYNLNAGVSKTGFTISDCRVCRVNVNISPIALNAVNPIIDRSLVDLNQKINTYNFKDKFDPIWKSLFTNITVAGIGYLSINPSAIALSNISGSGNLLHFDAGLTAKPVISLTDPGIPDIPPIPNLSSVDATGFSVYLDGHLQYPELVTLLKNSIIGKKIMYKKRGYILIRDIDLQGNGNNHLVVKINFKAKYHWITYRGNLYFTCLPNYDPTEKKFYVSDIHFDPVTQQSLTSRGAAWILNTVITTFLNNEIKVPVGTQIDELKNKLTEGLNRNISNDVLLAGSITDFNIKGMLPTQQYILLRVLAMGAVSVTIK